MAPTPSSATRARRRLSRRHDAALRRIGAQPTFLQRVIVEEWHRAVASVEGAMFTRGLLGELRSPSPDPQRAADLIPWEAITVALRPRLAAALHTQIVASGIAALEEPLFAPPTADQRFYGGPFIVKAVADATPATKAAGDPAPDPEREFDITRVPASDLMRLDPSDAAILRWIDANLGSLITQVTASTRQSIIDMVTAAVNEDPATSMTDLARRIGDLLAEQSRDAIAPDQLRLAQVRLGIGLHPRWARAVNNFWASQIADGTDPSTAMRHALAYRNRLLDKRAMAIARTETLRAMNAGRTIAWDQAAREGFFDTDTAGKQWLVGPHFDPRNPGPHKRRTALTTESPCSICAPMADEIVPYDEDFSTDRGPLPHPPAHTHCRCTVILLPDHFAPEPPGD